MTREEQFTEIYNTADLLEQIKLTEKYLSVYPDIDSLIARSFSKNSLLHLACLLDNVDLVEFLLKRNANVNITHGGHNPLHSAILNDDKHNNQFEIIKLLTSSGVNIRQQTESGYRHSCFLLALECCQLATVEYLDKNYPESCSGSSEFATRGLHAASGNEKDCNVLTYCLALDQDVNRLDDYGDTPLLKTFGEKNKTAQLLKLGADINFQDPSGISILHISVDTEVDTAINYAKALDVSNTEFLLANGADKTLVDEDGYTALETATRFYGGVYESNIYTELFARY